MKKIIISLLILICLFQTISFAEETTYKSYTYDATGRSIPAPAPYTAEKVLAGSDCKTQAFKEPSDLYVSNGMIYIADTGNNRIVVLDSGFAFVKEIKSVNINGAAQNLKNPKGVFVDTKGYLYIADTGNNRVIICDEKGNTVKVLMRPESDLIPTDIEYKPEKVVADSAGTVYVEVNGIYQGLVTYDDTGSFSGFFGSNKVEMSLENLALYTWKSIFSKEQKGAMIRFIPVEYSNIYIDKSGFIYTSTLTTKTSLDEIKKLNALGQNILRTPSTGVLYPKNNFGDIEKDMQQGKQLDSKFSDVHVDEDGIISALDNERGRVFQYDQDLNLLFVFGDKGTQMGMTTQPTAIEKLNDNYLILDSVQNTLTVMKPTYYCSLFRKAVKLYNNGEYEASQKTWREILSLNSNCLMAYRGIGKTYLQQEKYSEALVCFKKAQDRESYSEAMSIYRKDVIRKYLLVFLLALVLIIWGLAGICRLILNKLGFKSKSQKMIFR